MIGRIRICLGISSDAMVLWVSSNSRPLNLLLVRCHQAEIIIVKRLVQGRNNVTRVEPKSCDQGCRKNDALPPWPRCRLVNQFEFRFSKVSEFECSFSKSLNLN